MEFWGVEVKPGEVLNCDPGDDKYLHLSQAALGEIQNPKGNERVPLYVHAEGKKLVIGTLVFGKCDQLSLDLVFDGEFGLSHSCTSGSVFFSGYSSLSEDRVDGTEMGGDETDSDSEDERQAQALMSRVKENGQTEAKPVKPELKKEGAKPYKSGPVTTGKAAAKVKSEDTKSVSGRPGEGEESSDDDDEEEEDSSDGESDDLGDSVDESDDDESQKTPMVEATGKKRPLPDSATKTPGATDKKAKTTVPGQAKKPGTDGGKKDGPKTPVEHSALGSKNQKGQTPKAKGTPGPKETPKTPATPGSGSGKKIGAHLCATCSRNLMDFNINITKFNGSNYGLWRDQMIALLKSKGLWMYMGSNTNIDENKQHNRYKDEAHGPIMCLLNQI